VPILESRELGKIFLDSDVINTAMNLEEKVISGIHWDSVKSYESMIKILELLKKTKGALFFAHDAAFFEKMKKAPNYYL